MTQPETPATEKPGCPKCGAAVRLNCDGWWRCGLTHYLQTAECKVVELTQALAAAQARERRLREMLLQSYRPPIREPHKPWLWTDAEIDAALAEEPHDT